jgi:hypothetical protein
LHSVLKVQEEQLEQMVHFNGPGRISGESRTIDAKAKHVVDVRVRRGGAALERTKQ